MKKVLNRILKVIQILVDLLMASMGISLAIAGMGNSTYYFSDWHVHMIAVVLGIVTFNILFEYIKKQINDF